MSRSTIVRFSIVAVLLVLAFICLSLVTVNADGGDSDVSIDVEEADVLETVNGTPRPTRTPRATSTPRPPRATATPRPATATPTATALPLPAGRTLTDIDGDTRIVIVSLNDASECGPTLRGKTVKFVSTSGQDDSQTINDAMSRRGECVIAVSRGFGDDHRAGSEFYITSRR